MLRCKGKTVKGLPCKAPAVRGGLCLIHSEPGKAKELAAKSVDRRRDNAERARGAALERLATPETPAEVNAVLREALAQVRNGDLDTDTARVMSALGQTIFKGFEVVNMAAELAELRDRLASVSPSGKVNRA